MSGVLKTISLSNPVYDEVEEAVRKEYPNSCLLWVQQVIHPELRTLYEKQKRQIELKRGFVKELRLFHGTSEEAMRNIVSQGFDPAMNKTSAFGIGTYFAASAQYSKDYAKPKKDQISYMLLCNVLMGTYCKGSPNSVIDTMFYDVAVNDLNHPTIYVTPYQYGAIPEYIIAFHREAK